MNPTYEVLALRYATTDPDRPRRENFMPGMDLHDAPMPLDYYIWVIRGHGRLVVVDTGFGKDAAKERHRTLLHEPAALLKRAGIDAAAVPDVVLTHDTGCVTTLDKSQFAAVAHDRKVGVPVMSDAQFVALAMGAHPYRIVQLHWHGADYRPLLEKMGIDWEARWKEFEGDLDRIRSGETEYLSWEDAEANV